MMMCCLACTEVSRTFQNDDVLCSRKGSWTSWDVLAQEVSKTLQMIFPSLQTNFEIFLEQRYYLVYRSFQNHICLGYSDVSRIFFENDNVELILRSSLEAFREVKGRFEARPQVHSSTHALALVAASDNHPHCERFTFCHLQCTICTKFLSFYATMFFLLNYRQSCLATSIIHTW